MSETAKDAVVAPTRRGVKILLAVSLALNMLVIGSVAGVAISHWRGGETRFGPREIAYGPYTRALSHEDRKAIGAALRQEAGSFEQNLPKTRETYRALMAALQADEYDRDAVHQLMRDQQAMGLKRQQIGQRLLLERLDGMTHEERQAFAKRLRGALQRGSMAARRDSNR